MPCYGHEPYHTLVSKENVPLMVFNFIFENSRRELTFVDNDNDICIFIL